MLNVVIFGAPGSGKGTQSEWVEAYNLAQRQIKLLVLAERELHSVYEITQHIS